MRGNSTSKVRIDVKVTPASSVEMKEEVGNELKD